jgi:hypothetical protein
MSWLESLQTDRKKLAFLINGFEYTKAINIVAELGIPDLLANGPEKAEVLAGQAGAHPEYLGRVMRYLAAFGLFSRDQNGAFSLTPLGGLLRSGPGTMRASAIMNGGDAYKAAEGLLHTVRTGEPCWHHIFGQTMQEYFEQHPERGRWFNLAMQRRFQSYESLPQLFDLSHYELIVDVGGGTGALIAVALRSSPSSRGILFELPKVAQHAREYLQTQGLADRCQVVAGSAFDSAPPGGDLYILSWVLHDFLDDDARKILKTVRAAMGDHKSELVVLEGVVPEEIRLMSVIEMDFAMMYVGGKERTEAEWRELLTSARFNLAYIRRTDPYVGYDVIVAQPA